MTGTSSIDSDVDRDHALRELAGLLLSTDSFQQLVQQITTLAVAVIPGTKACGITVSYGGRPITVASSSQLGSVLDERQYDLDEGPCLEALRTTRVVSAADLARDGRWDGYPAIAMAHGISAIHSTPLVVGGTAVGVLNLYAAEPATFDGPDQQERVDQVTAVGAVAINSSLRHSGDVELTRQMQAALTSRSTIDQALGIVMATQRCNADHAFTVLRGISQSRNLRLHRIARELVERTGAPDADPR